MNRVFKQDYVHIPAEPILPYLKAPTLFHPINLVKQWLLKGLWGINRKQGEQFPTACFLGFCFLERWTKNGCSECCRNT